MPAETLTTTRIFIAAAEDAAKIGTDATLAQIISALKTIDGRLERVERSIRALGGHPALL